MKYVLLIAILIGGGSNVFASEPFHTTNQEIEILDTMDMQLNSARKKVQELVQGNAKVLHQFDAFAQTLKRAYVSGEGLIHKDVYRIIDAIEFAAYHHRFQKRKDPDNTPYIIHPIGVANYAMTIGKVRDPDIIIGCILHDTVEDTEVTDDQVNQRFGDRIAGFIREVTDNKSLPKQTRKLLQIEHAPEKSAGAAQIKLADKLYNLTDLLNVPPTDWEVERIDAYFQWAQAVVDRLPWVNAPLKKAVDGVIKSYWDSKEVKILPIAEDGSQT